MCVCQMIRISAAAVLKGNQRDKQKTKEMAILTLELKQGRGREGNCMYTYIYTRVCVCVCVSFQREHYGSVLYVGSLETERYKGR